MEDCGVLSANAQWWLTALVFVVNAFVERWLGRTNKTRAASLLDLLAIGFRRLFNLKKQETTLVVKEGEPKEGTKNGDS
jgi:hypothetical protein